MSTPSSAEITTVYSTGTRAIDPIILRNTSSVDCPDSGIIVLLLPSPVNEPEPTLQWRIDPGAWQGTSLSWDNGVVNGNASCASPCWKAAIVTLDVPAHTTYTIELAVIFHSGLNYGAFDGGVYYTGHAVIPDGVAGPIVAWDYYNQTGGGSGGGGSAAGRNPSPAASSRTDGSSQPATASPGASPSASAATATPTVSSSPPATPTATANLTALADAHPGHSGMSTSTVTTLIAVAALALAVGTGLVLTRRRRGNPPQPRA